MNIKPGVKTTEFWAMLAGVGAIGWSFVQQNCTLDPLKMYSLVGIVGAYIAGRTYLKARAMPTSPTTGQVPVVPSIEK